MPWAVKRSAIGFNGVAAGFLKNVGRVGLVVADQWFGGVRLSLSADKAHFTDLKEPLLPVDATDWQRPAPTDLIAYLSILDPENGSNVVGGDFLLAMVYVPPGETFAHRYLALQPVHVAMRPEPVSPQVRTALTRWRKAKNGATRASTGPVVDRAFTLDLGLGYLMTRAPEGVASVKLEECAVSGQYRLEIDGTCARDGGTRLRTAGWAYDSPEPGALPLYRCRDAGAAFISNDPACEDRGKAETRLGFALAD